MLDAVRDFGGGEGEEACLTWGGNAEHASKPELPEKEVRCKKTLYANFFQQVKGGDEPVTKWTSLICADTGLPWMLKAVQNKETIKYVIKLVDDNADKWGHAISYQEEEFCKLDDINTEKLNMGALLGKVFTGSKLYLFTISITILFQVYSQTAKAMIEGEFDRMWNETAVCSINGTAGY